MEPKDSFLVIIGNYWILSWATWAHPPAYNYSRCPSWSLTYRFPTLPPHACYIPHPQYLWTDHLNMRRVYSVCSLLNDAFSRSDFIALRLTVQISKLLIMQFPSSYAYFLPPRRTHLNKYQTKNVLHAQFRRNKCGYNIHLEIGTCQNFSIYHYIIIIISWNYY